MLAERIAWLVCGLCLGSAWAADEAPEEQASNDSDFIEYLGLWEESDEEWAMFDEVKDSEDLPETEPETEDES